MDEQGGSSNAETFFNMTRILMGMGMLTMPAAVARVGLIPASIITVIVAGVSYFTWTWAVSLKSKLASTPRKGADSTEEDPLYIAEAAPEAAFDGSDTSFPSLGGFDSVVQEVMGTVGRICLVAFVFEQCFTGGIMHVSAIEEGLRIVFPAVPQYVGLIAICGVLLLLTLLAPDLQNIAFLSLASGLLLLYITISMPMEGLLSGEHSKVLLWNFSAGILDWGYAFGAVDLTYGGIGVGLALYDDMKHKEDYKMVTGAAMVSSAAISVVFGAAGYWAFGTDIKELAYLNFPPGSVTSYICIAAYTLLLLACYMVVMTPCFLVTRSLFPSVPYSIIRCSLIVLTGLISKMMPLVMQIYLLLTCLDIQLVELVMPAVCYLCKGNKHDILQRAIACGCLAVAAAGGCTGFISGLQGKAVG